MLIIGTWRNYARAEAARAQVAALTSLPVLLHPHTASRPVAVVLAGPLITRQRGAHVLAVQQLGGPVLVLTDDQLWPLEAWRPVRTRGVGAVLEPAQDMTPSWAAEQAAAAARALAEVTA